MEGWMRSGWWTVSLGGTRCDWVEAGLRFPSSKQSDNDGYETVKAGARLSSAHSGGFCSLNTNQFHQLHQSEQGCCGCVGLESDL